MLMTRRHFLAATAAAPLLGLDWAVGAEAGGLAMTGDLLSSFVKRRIGIEPSGRAFGLDQIPESLLPLLALQGMLDLSLLQVAAITSAFVLLATPVARLSHRLGLRERPF